MSNNYFSTGRKWATIEHLVDVVMVVFALASIGNISEYMRVHGHNVVTAYGVGVALGLGLVAISIMLARVPTDDKRTFASMAAATIAVGLLSGTVQTLAYYDHTGNVWTASLQGYGFPIVGECLLAVAMAFYTASERRRRARQADEGMEERINEAITDALSNIDITGMQSYIEKQAGVILRHKMSEIVQRRIGGVSRQARGCPGGAADDLVELVTPQEITETNKASVAEMNEARQRLIDDRREAIAQLFATYGTMAIGDLQKRLKDDRGIDASERTLRNDLQAMEVDGRLTKTGRGRWAATRVIRSTLPTLAGLVSNGNGSH